MSRDFLIQRYCSDSHPQVRGLRPFVATGSRFMEWALAGSLQRLGQWAFRPELYSGLSRAFPPAAPSVPEDRAIVAEFLLQEGIVEALWSVDSPECLPVDLRWKASLEQVTDEIPFLRADSTLGRIMGGPYDMALWTIELLSGLSGPEHFRSYVSEDGLILEGFSPVA